MVKFNKKQKLFGIFFFISVSPILLISLVIQKLLMPLSEYLFAMDIKVQQIVHDKIFEPINRRLK